MTNKTETKRNTTTFYQWVDRQSDLMKAFISVIMILGTVAILVAYVSFLFHTIGWMYTDSMYPITYSIVTFFVGLIPPICLIVWVCWICNDGKLE